MPLLPTLLRRVILVYAVKACNTRKCIQLRHYQDQFFTREAFRLTPDEKEIVMSRLDAVQVDFLRASSMGVTETEKVIDQYARRQTYREEEHTHALNESLGTFGDYQPPFRFEPVQMGYEREHWCVTTHRLHIGITAPPTELDPFITVLYEHMRGTYPQYQANKSTTQGVRAWRLARCSRWL